MRIICLKIKEIHFVWSTNYRHFRNEKDFRRLLRLLLGAGKTNWPIADQRVPNNDPRSLCESLVVPVSLSLSVILVTTFFLENDHPKGFKRVKKTCLQFVQWPTKEQQQVEGLPHWSSPLAFLGMTWNHIKQKERKEEKKDYKIPTM